MRPGAGGAAVRLLAALVLLPFAAHADPFGCDHTEPSALPVLKLFDAEDLQAHPQQQKEPSARLLFYGEQKAAVAAQLEAAPEPGPEYLNGIGAPGRCWELTSDTAYSAYRVLTERIELGRALKIRRYLSVVVRARIGVDGSFASGAVAYQALVPSLGLRHQPHLDGYALEAGVRLLPAWGGPRGSNQPRMQVLALNATLTSGLGSDGTWLPLSTTGVQLYIDVLSRTKVLSTPPAALVFGARYGGEFLVSTAMVRTWLGPQSAFIANAWFEGFTAFTRMGHLPMPVQVGVHADVSLSSIWPGDTLFPVVFGAFVGWSPQRWVALRGFVGFGTSATSRPQATGGVRLQFYVP